MVARFAVEVWDPDFGAAVPAAGFRKSEAEVDPFVERSASTWAPIDTRPVELGSIAFIDGVRRIDAMVWISDGPRIDPGICASCAAGSVEGGRIHEVKVRREVFTFTRAAMDPIPTTVGRYDLAKTKGSDIENLYLAVQRRLRDLEREVASGITDGDKLVVIDGPLSASHPKAGAVGYIKTHQVRYLADELLPIIHQLESGQRTPLFLTTTSWRRYSCYLRLPGARTHPWAGVVRLEVDGSGTLADAVRIVDRASAALSRFASLPHKDPRAPQNLFPIGGLERELRRRLGDARLVHRALLEAAIVSGRPGSPGEPTDSP